LKEKGKGCELTAQELTKYVVIQQESGDGNKKEDFRLFITLDCLLASPLTADCL
jgi:hypothetical protein